MNDHERFRLLFGPYRMPRRTRLGGRLDCRRCGPVKVCAISAGLISWPMTRRATGGRPFLILCGDLVRAVQKESGQAVAHHWGVTLQTVTAWRRLLGVERGTAGTRALHGRWSDETVGSETATERRTEALKRPERAAKIAAAKRGKPRPPATVEKMRKAMKGRKPSKETRERMSAAHRARGTRPPAAGVPWTEAELAILGTMLDREVAERTGRTLAAVQSMRYVLGVAAFGRRE